MADELETLEDGRPARGRGGTPFDSIEGVTSTWGSWPSHRRCKAVIQQDITEARGQGGVRRVQALQIIAFKLEKLGGHVRSSRRILNDLRTLRRLPDGRAQQDSEATRLSFQPI